MMVSSVAYHGNDISDVSDNSGNYCNFHCCRVVTAVAVMTVIASCASGTCGSHSATTSQNLLVSVMTSQILLLYSSCSRTRSVNSVNSGIGYCAHADQYDHDCNNRAFHFRFLTFCFCKS